MTKKTEKFGHSRGHENRKVNTREEKKVQDEVPKIVFSFRDFIFQEPGQSWADWEKEGLLAALMEKLGHISKMTLAEAKAQNIIGIYDEFPTFSDFTCPNCFPPNTKWASIKHIKGRKGRIAGHIIGHTFYIVFLDKNHVFYKTKPKKHKKHVR